MDQLVPDDWAAALTGLRESRRILVLGATDMGKSSFIRALSRTHGGGLRLLDLDPGQKMVGPPGTASAGYLDEAGAARLDRFIFLGSTSTGSFTRLTQAGASLAEGAAAFVVNTPGYVQGPGARLQSMTVAALQPDAIVAIGDAPSLEPVVAAAAGIPVHRLARPPVASRKSPSVRARIRQAAFEEALLAGQPIVLGPDVSVEPGPPLLPPENPIRPVCSLADAAGADMCIGIVEQAQDGLLHIHARVPERPVRIVRLGKMWAAPSPEGWRLMERLSPAWIE